MADNRQKPHVGSRSIRTQSQSDSASLLGLGDYHAGHSSNTTSWPSSLNMFRDLDQNHTKYPCSAVTVTGVPDSRTPLAQARAFGESNASIRQDRPWSVPRDPSYPGTLNGEAAKSVTPMQRWGSEMMRSEPWNNIDQLAVADADCGRKQSSKKKEGDAERSMEANPGSDQDVNTVQAWEDGRER